MTLVLHCLPHSSIPPFPHSPSAPSLTQTYMNAPRPPVWQLSSHHPDTTDASSASTPADPDQPTARCSLGANYMPHNFCTRGISSPQSWCTATMYSTHVPEQTAPPSHKTSAAHLDLFKSHNQFPPDTEKHELNFQRPLFISNERHRTPSTKWHLSEKSVTLTTARLVLLSSRCNVDTETQARTALGRGFLTYRIRASERS